MVGMGKLKRDEAKRGRMAMTQLRKTLRRHGSTLLKNLEEIQRFQYFIEFLPHLSWGSL
ncbi:hypothetical protein M747DRAFT_296815 [Aspergillus niger ATCC 13496]|uniref:Uncharacterized protein n=1 Tax=Aspergillus niger ATCC 13496 TaxID=1353008 RepID=A0A370BTK0_ASPNG|nr:hypothetical protein M747DRAFT_296815 [Aspergillus niger ATCC 13496]